MKNQTVKQLASKAKVSVRTLHYYDQIGLLNPSSRSPKGYRLYSFQDQLKLQQILFFKELNFPLKEIKQLITNPNFNPEETLIKHRVAIKQKITSYKDLLNTLNKTIKNYNQKNMTHDLYEGFSPEEAKQYRQEAIQKWGDKVAESKKKLSRLSKQEFQNLKAEGVQIATDISILMSQNKPANSSETQAKIREYHHHMQNYYDCTLQIFQGLGQMYVQDPRFKKYYEDIQKGLAKYISQAIQIYTSNSKTSL
jgi:DNA-binding transcriptional MerR regulator